MSNDDLTPMQLLSLRWVILTSVHAGNTIGVSDTMCGDVAATVYPGMSMGRIRQELDYLEGLEMVVLKRSEIMPWRANITPQGRDVVEYVAEPPAGIIRPPLN